MLSNPLHRFSPYHAISSPISHHPTDTMHTSDLDALAQGSHLALQQLQHHVGLQVKHRQNTYGSAGAPSASVGHVRRRISRACDQCNQLRTKCDGQNPCAHCTEFGLGCEYIRERKKRGKASRKDLARQAAAQAAATAVSQGKTDDGQNSGDSSDQNDGIGRSNRESVMIASVEQSGSAAVAITTPIIGDSLMSDLADDELQRSRRTGSLESLGDIGSLHVQLDHSSTQQQQQGLDSSPVPSLDLNGYGPVHTPPYAQRQVAASAAEESALSAMGSLGAAHVMNGVATGHTSYTTPAAMSGYPDLSTYNLSQLRYPVLEPLVPHLGGIMPLSLACDLIDLYFTSSSSARMHPMSPYVLSFVFRKRSFLHPTKPRRCQPALLASMLWVTAQTSDAPFLTRVPSARLKTCQKLLDLTIGLLRPLVHAPSSAADMGSPTDNSTMSSMLAMGVMGAVSNGLGMSLGGDSFGLEGGLAGLSGTAEHSGGGRAVFGAAGTLDDVITYMHLATVVSASEYKGASLRWWNAAWSLARELKLGRELPPNPPSRMPNPMSHQYYHGSQALDGNDLGAEDESEDGMVVSEEAREERRRIWWLVYLVDRHLALCYNRPLFLLDVECENLLQPMDESAWQNGNFEKNTSTNINTATGPDVEINLASTPNPLLSPDDGTRKSDNSPSNSRGPTFICRGHSIFGFFLPLMTILGEIVDLHHLRNHPRFGVGFRSSREWKDQVAQITQHLGIYEQSLRAFEQENLNPAVLAAAARDEQRQQQQQQAEREAAEKNGTKNKTASDGNAIGSPQAVDTPLSQQDGSAATADIAAAISNGPAASGPVLSPPSSSPSSSPSPPLRMTELDIQTSIVTAYGTHVMHVLHVLLIGKWDPISLLDDDDLWISSPGFITATGHAVAAAEAISRILEHDPGLEFMPYYFGIYLLQGSFLLLLIADKLQLEASASVTRACETIVRAHEACCVTLNTEYQRNFSRVMRSALAQTSHSDADESY
ncbi:c6 zinc finger domain containing protein [Grosmannia clavigera kw1407]|uniref:C6 zinc finger domain containing protein n=1 Tax=Grosmannia clavigera (strain kw1407 / UAMH 11150) TaxID=655863 RepID=F0X8M3_GROCL|nr:c6 zinc finger domain containing protein [Grosmannia clavigera kw1407]EFX06108.1 c6 zinc finger domain containing protein [Grosmannia clavigera kw1407]